jgi:hypothetical protein
MAGLRIVCSRRHAAVEKAAKCTSSEDGCSNYTFQANKSGINELLCRGLTNFNLTISYSGLPGQVRPQRSPADGVILCTGGTQPAWK